MLGNKLLVEPELKGFYIDDIQFTTEVLKEEEEKITFSRFSQPERETFNRISVVQNVGK